MTVATVAQVTRTRITFVAPLSEHEHGRQMYFEGKRLFECATDEIAQGWCDAESAGYVAYLDEMEAAGVPAASAIEDDRSWIRSGC